MKPNLINLLRDWVFMNPTLMAMNQPSNLGCQWFWCLRCTWRYSNAQLDSKNAHRKKNALWIFKSLGNLVQLFPSDIADLNLLRFRQHSQTFGGAHCITCQGEPTKQMSWPTKMKVCSKKSTKMGFSQNKMKIYCKRKCASTWFSKWTCTE